MFYSPNAPRHDGDMRPSSPTTKLQQSHELQVQIEPVEQIEHQGQLQPQEQPAHQLPVSNFTGAPKSSSLQVSSSKLHPNDECPNISNSGKHTNNSQLSCFGLDRLAPSLVSIVHNNNANTNDCQFSENRHFYANRNFREREVQNKEQTYVASHAKLYTSNEISGSSTNRDGGVVRHGFSYDGTFVGTSSTLHFYHLQQQQYLQRYQQHQQHQQQASLSDIDKNYSEDKHNPALTTQYYKSVTANSSDNTTSNSNNIGNEKISTHDTRTVRMKRNDSTVVASTNVSNYNHNDTSTYKTLSSDARITTIQEEQYQWRSQYSEEESHTVTAALPDTRIRKPSSMSQNYCDNNKRMGNAHSTSSNDYNYQQLQLSANCTTPSVKSTSGMQNLSRDINIDNSNFTHLMDRKDENGCVGRSSGRLLYPSQLLSFSSWPQQQHQLRHQQMHHTNNFDDLAPISSSSHNEGINSITNSNNRPSSSNNVEKVQCKMQNSTEERTSSKHGNIKITQVNDFHISSPSSDCINIIVNKKKEKDPGSDIKGINYQNSHAQTESISTEDDTCDKKYSDTSNYYVDDVKAAKLLCFLQLHSPSLESIAEMDSICLDIVHNDGDTDNILHECDEVIRFGPDHSSLESQTQKKFDDFNKNDNSYNGIPVEHLPSISEEIDKVTIQSSCNTQEAAESFISKDIDDNNTTIELNKKGRRRGKAGRPPKEVSDPCPKDQIAPASSSPSPELLNQTAFPDLRNIFPPWEKLIGKDSRVALLEDRDELFAPEEDQEDPLETTSVEASSYPVPSETIISSNTNSNSKVLKRSSSSLVGTSTLMITPAIREKARLSIDPSFDALFVAMAQMVPCSLSLDDQNSAITSYKHHHVGFPGLQCRHCGGRPGSGRYFPNSVRSLSQTTTAHNMIKHFVHASTVVPDEDDDTLGGKSADVDHQQQQQIKNNDDICYTSDPELSSSQTTTVSQTRIANTTENNTLEAKVTTNVKTLLSLDTDINKKIKKNGGRHCTHCPYSVWLWLTEFQRRLSECKSTNVIYPKPNESTGEGDDFNTGITDSVSNSSNIQLRQDSTSSSNNNSSICIGQRVKYGARKIFYNRVWNRMTREVTGFDAHLDARPINHVSNNNSKSRTIKKGHNNYNIKDNNFSDDNGEDNSNYGDDDVQCDDEERDETEDIDSDNDKKIVLKKRNKLVSAQMSGKKHDVVTTSRPTTKREHVGQKLSIISAATRTTANIKTEKSSKKRSATITFLDLTTIDPTPSVVDQDDEEGIFPTVGMGNKSRLTKKGAGTIKSKNKSDNFHSSTETRTTKNKRQKMTTRGAK